MSTYTPILPGQVLTYTAEPSARGTRLDLFLFQQNTGYSRSYFQNLIEQGAVAINGVKASKPSVTVKALDTVTITVPTPAARPTTRESVSHLGITVVYENEHFLIANKPPHLSVHTPGPNNTELTIVDWLLAHDNAIKGVGDADRPGIVHRLDKDTSGLLLIAKNPYSHAKLSELFKNREIHKTYYAIVEGHTPKAGVIDANIIRHPIHRTKMTHCRGQGRQALTRYVAKEFLKNATWVEAMPVTGRTHQIRVHFASIEHPLIGDAVYHTKSPLINRQALHAYRLTFTFEGQAYDFTQEPPQDFMDLVEALQV